MRQRLFAIIMAIAALTSCTTDPIHNGDPVDTTYSTGFPLDQFHELGQAGDTIAQHQLVDQYRRQLTANVVRHYPEIQDEKDIKFILGSGYAKQVLTGSGKTHSGKFQNELIIIIDDPSIKDTLFLACGNGMLRPLKFHDSLDFGTAEQWRYTILPGQGLAHHLPALQEWAEVANNLSIPIKDKNGKIVSQETYLNYLGRYQSLLFPYDVVDVLNGEVYNRLGQEVDFDRRQLETQKANAEAAAKAKATQRKARSKVKRGRK